MTDEQQADYDTHERVGTGAYIPISFSMEFTSRFLSLSARRVMELGARGDSNHFTHSMQPSTFQKPIPTPIDRHLGAGQTRPVDSVQAHRA